MPIASVLKTAICALLLASLSLGATRPIIFDTDMGNDIDDALALAMLHAFTDRGECRLIGVTLTNANPAAVPYVRMLNRFYGRGDLPVGSALRPLKDGAQDGYLTAALRQAPPRYQPGRAVAESALTVLRRLLTASPDKVVIVQTGFSTNLAALLESEGGPALIREKVALVVAMAGNFADGAPEYNVRVDLASAKKVFDDWPTPIVFSGFEIGRDLPYPAAAIDRDFNYAPWHPLAASYRAYKKMPYDRPTWDLTAVLEAVRPGYFESSPPGSVNVDRDGRTTFHPGTGDRTYLKLVTARKPEILTVLELLASEPPSR